METYLIRIPTVQTFAPYFRKILSNIIYPFMPRSSVPDIMRRIDSRRIALSIVQILDFWLL
jgi:hypothetical protein